MTQNIEPTNNTTNYFDNYDFLNFSYKQIQNFKKCKTFGGKNGIGFENDPEKYNKLVEELNNDTNLKTQKILKGKPSNIIINENTIHHFKFTLCEDYIEYLPGLNETKESIENAIKLSSDFVYISQNNFDSDVTLFKKGFKTYYSDWKAYTNHMTSNMYFNLLFELYKLGLIEDYIIFYTEPIENSNSKYIHPQNSSSDQGTFNSEIHPYKREDIKFHNIFHKLNIIITIKGFKDMDSILKKIEEEKTIIFYSKNGTYEEDLEDSIENNPEPKKGLFGKVNDLLS